MKAVCPQQVQATMAGSACSASINSLWPCDAIWRHRSGSTLAQVMACCLMAPSHYPNQCWVLINKVLHLRAISQWVHMILLCIKSLKIILIILLLHLPRANELNSLTLMTTVTLYGVAEICQHWFRFWLGAVRHQAITWTNGDLSTTSSWKKRISMKYYS